MQANKVNAIAEYEVALSEQDRRNIRRDFNALYAYLDKAVMSGLERPPNIPALSELLTELEILDEE